MRTFKPTIDNKNNAGASADTILYLSHEICRVYIKYLIVIAIEDSPEIVKKETCHLQEHWPLYETEA